MILYEPTGSFAATDVFTDLAVPSLLVLCPSLCLRAVVCVPSSDDGQHAAAMTHEGRI